MVSSATHDALDPDPDDRVVMHEQDWRGFQTLLALRGDRGRPRVAYLDGTVELMTPSRGHERTKTKLGALLEHYCVARDILVNPYGEWLLEDESEEAGAEPDECYIFGPDPESKPRPDLVIEVEWTRGGLNKLEIYRRLAIDEVWRWRRDAITVYGLVGDRYVERTSKWIPALDLAVLCELATVSPLNDAVKQLLARLPR